MSPAKTPEPIEMPFGILTHIGPRNLYVRWVYIGATWRIWFNNQTWWQCRLLLPLLKQCV